MTPSSSSENIIFEPYPKQLEFIEAVFSGKYSFLCYGGAMGGGKLLRLDEPIPTPEGWTTMGKLSPGSLVIDADGNPCRVMAISDIEENPESYRVTFSDGAVIEADAGHQWITLTRKERIRLYKAQDSIRERRKLSRPPKGTKRPDLTLRNSLNTPKRNDPRGSIRTTKQILSTLKDGPFFNHTIVNCSAIDLPPKDLPIQPYTFGAWLGDGTSSGGGLTGIDSEVWDEIQKEGYRIGHHKKPSSHVIYGIIPTLRELDVLNNKHIPTMYLRASIEQRLALLQGLCDTDGYCDPKKGSIEFTTTSERIKDGFLELVYSLGIKPSCREGLSSLNGAVKGKKWRIQFWHDMPCFRIKRKVVRQKLKKGRNYRSIVAVEKCAPVPMRCIAVDSPSRTYLCSRRMIPTHNSFVCLAVAILLSKVYPGSIWCVIRESLPTLKKTSLATFMKVCPKQFIAAYNQQDQVVTFTNGSKLLFMAEDYANDKDFDRFKGLEVSGFVLEQIEELNEGLLDVCFIRAGRHKLPKQPPPLVIANVNPTLMWPKAKIYDAYNAGTLPKDWYYLPAKITDNPALYDDKAYMDRLNNLDALTRRRLIDGDWTAFAVKSPFLYSFSLAKHEIEAYAPNPHLPLIVSFDFNKDPMTCLVGQSIDLRHLCIFDEMKIANGSTPELCEMIQAKYNRWLGQIYVTGDASGHNRSPLVRGGVNHYLLIKKALGIKDGQFWVRKQNLSHINSRILCNSVLQNANFTITKNCKETVADCVYASVDEEGELIKTVKEGRHFFDNVRYMIDSKFPDFIQKPHKYQK